MAHCQCGCGGETTLAKRTRPSRGTVAGQPNRYLPGHGSFLRQRHLTADGYVLIRMPEHPRAAAGFVLEHIVVVERLLGCFLAEGVVIHHVGEKYENGPGKLAVLQNQSEHRRLHSRLRVLRAGGNPWTQALCTYCQCPKAFADFYRLKSGRISQHCKACRRARSRLPDHLRQRKWTRRKPIEAA